MRGRTLLIFDDGRGCWGPVMDLRAVFEQRTGAITTRRRIERTLGLSAGACWVAPDGVALATQRLGHFLRINQRPTDGRWLLVNGRWNGLRLAQRVLDLSLGSVLLQADGQIIAAYVDHAQAAEMLDHGFDHLPEGVETYTVHGRVLLERPWHILEELEDVLDADLRVSDVPLATKAPDGVTIIGDQPVHVAASAIVEPMVVINAQRGPVVIDRGACICSLSILEGPCYVGPESIVASHAAIRSHTVLGPVCKVGGEVSFSIIQGYSNKAHAGFLGHSLVGSWVNLGADTNVSNLKNTYGCVRVQLQPDSELEDTGLMFLGPIIGDYVCTGVGTCLVTGSCIGTGAMISLSTLAPKYVGRLTFCTDAETQRYEEDRFIGTAQRMMARRYCTLSPAEEERLRALAAR